MRLPKLTLLENLEMHAKDELKRAGYNLETEIDEIYSDDDYSNVIAQNVYEMIKTFSSAGHSGFSAEAALSMFEKLARYENLTPITSNSEEWEDMSEQSGYSLWQNKRNPKYFSEDAGKTWWALTESVLNKAIQILKEDPDDTGISGASAGNAGSYAFGYWKNILYVSQEYSAHWDIQDERGIKLSKEDMKKIGDTQLNREDFLFSGRVFTKHKILSFWIFPSPSELRKIIKDLNSNPWEKKIKIDKSWFIEVLEDKKTPTHRYVDYAERKKEKLIPISEYMGSKSRSKEDLAKQHVQSPMIKGKREVPSGVGSKKKYPDMKPGETIAQYKARKTTSESKKRKTKPKKDGLRKSIAVDGEI